MAPVCLVPASILQNYQFTTVNEVYYSSETYLTINLELHTSIVAMATEETIVPLYKAAIGPVCFYTVRDLYNLDRE